MKFWAVIALGDKTDDAAGAAGVSSPVGYRWFRHAGGVNPRLPPAVLGRHLSFSEREDIALYRTQGLGVREIARRPGRSPSTIARRLPVEFPNDASMLFSHEAIYQALYIRARGALKGELVACLRSGRALRSPRA